MRYGDMNINYVITYYEIVDNKYEIRKKVVDDLHECICFLKTIEYDQRHELVSVM